MNARTAWSVAVVSVLASRPMVTVAQDVVPDVAVRALAGDIAHGVQPSLTALPPARAHAALRVMGAVPDALRDSFITALRTGLTVPATGSLDALAMGDDRDAAIAAAIAADDDALLLVTLSTEGRNVSAHVEVVRVQGDPWESFVAPTPPVPVSLLRANWVRVPAPVTPPATALPSVPRWPAVPLARPRVVATPFHGTVALGIGDMDGDGRAELLLATTERVRVARLSGAALTFVPDSASSALMAAGQASVVSRQPFGSMAWYEPGHAMRLRTSAQRSMVAVSLAGGNVGLALHPANELFPAAGFGCVVVPEGTDTTTLALSDCGHGEAVRTALPNTRGAPVAAVPVALELHDAAGGMHRYEAFADGAGGVEVRMDGVRAAALTDVAPPLVLCDLDGDGRIEVLTASASEPGASDRLRVFTVTPGAVQERSGFTVPGPIEGIATGDLDGDGLPETVVAAHDPARHATTLWVLP